jgi:hypothetical protein
MADDSIPKQIQKADEVEPYLQDDCLKPEEATNLLLKWVNELQRGSNIIV